MDTPANMGRLEGMRAKLYAGERRENRSKA
jgi:hypothetical protein